MIKAIQIALTGLTGASKQAQASASNIANLTTTGTLDPADGPAPYTPVTVTQTAITDTAGNGQGVISDIVPSNRPPVPVYAPDSGAANADGLIGAPDIDLAGEIVNLQIANTTYKANAKTIQIASEMQDALLNMFDRKV